MLLAKECGPRCTTTPSVAPSTQTRRSTSTAGDHTVVVTTKRLAIGSRERLALNVPIDNLRRIQFDIERDRPATLVVVPQHPTDEPQVLMVRPTDYRGVADALVVIGQRLAGD